ncbi:MAG: M48 family metallopeptidase [Limisphaerales bacterium]
MTDFFERQNIARRKTKLLLCYFLPSVALTILGIYFVVLFALAFHGFHSRRHNYVEHVFHPSVIDWQLLGIVSIVTVFAVTLAAIYKAQQLACGGPAVAAMLGGRRINSNTTDPDERRLLDVVEEMAIASGVPVPEVYVLAGENGINAFVAGHDSKDAALGVTEGALRLLNRDELQAIVGHEFSHLLNGDMHLNLWLMSFLYGILFISLTGKFVANLYWDEDSSGWSAGRRGAPFVVVGAALFVIGYIGYFFGRLIKCAVCRQRECLADAAAVQFTRNPQALAGALKKIGGLVFGSRITGAEADEASHMFFSDVMPDSFLGLLSTHPPLEQRVLALDPSFNGKFEYIKSIPAQKREAGDAPPVITSVNDIPRLTRMPVATIVQIAQVLNDRTPPVQRHRLTPQHLTYATGLTASLPPDIAAAAREPFGATALVYALLLSPNESARTRQLSDLGPAANTSVISVALQYFPSICKLTNGQKLAVLNVATPSLRQMSRLQFDDFSKTVQQLIESDSEISLFEYSVQKTLLRHLAPYFSPTKPAIAQYYAAAGLAKECAVLLSALAYEGSEDNSEIAAAFQVGADDLEFPSNKQISLLSHDECNLAQIDAAVQKITESALPVKKQILNACALVVASDSLVKEEEAEMLRAIADAMGCPLPPFVSSIGIPEAA